MKTPTAVARASQQRDEAICNLKHALALEQSKPTPNTRELLSLTMDLGKLQDFAEMSGHYKTAVAVALGRMARGVPKEFTKAERERRRKRLAVVREKRWRKK